MNYVYQKPLSYEKTVGIVFGSFSPLHAGHLDVIYRAKKECEGGVLVVVTGYEGDKGCPTMPLEARYRMVREFFRDDDLVAVYCQSDDELGIAEYAERQDEWQWDTWLDGLYKTVIPVNMKPASWGRLFLEDNTVFYVGEQAYLRDLSARRLRCVLADRLENPVSGTMIRADPLKHWNDMAWTYHRVFSHNILVLGTASEGKTTLVEDIGRYFNLPYSFEWARSYIDKHMLGDWEFGAQDFLMFLAGQHEHNRDLIEGRLNPGIFISDSDCLTTRMFAEYYADDPEMALTRDEFDRILAPAADMYADLTRWDKIFVVGPRGTFVDDHSRYMKHADLDIRRDMSRLLMRELERSGRMNRVEFLSGTYRENFDRVKSYVNQVREGRKS